MGLRCLIGHDYGEPETTRERDDRGDEVVVTIREYKECVRCGERRTLSENTEVRATEPEPEPDPEPEPEPETATGSEFEDVSAAEDDGIILDDDEPGERSPGEWPEEDEAPESVEAPEEWPDAEASGVEDAEGDEGADDEAGEVTDAGEAGAWPEHEGEDEGIDAEAPEDAAADVAFGDGLAPEPGDAAADVEPEEEGADADGAGPAGIRSAAAGPDPTEGRVAGVGARFVCPECGHEVEAAESSLRPGDICPECQRGYLSERDG